MSQYDWYYDEFSQAGTDYALDDNVKSYDERMSKFRNIPEEVDNIISLTEMKKDHIVIDFGCGTSEFATEFAKHCQKVIGIDVSKAMLDYSQKKAETKNISNISFYQAGFLNYVHKEEPVDIIISQFALHHLSDFWKLIALKNLFDILKPKGKLYLKDVVFSFPPEKYDRNLDFWVKDMTEKAGEEMTNNTILHIKEEYSTWDWIMEEMLYRAGFMLKSADYFSNIIAQYVGIK